MSEEEVQLVVGPVLVVREIRRPRVSGAEDVRSQDPQIWGGTDTSHVGVDTEQLRRGEDPHLVHDERPPVTALCHELVVAETLHQLDPGEAMWTRSQPVVARLTREPVTRDRRNDHVKRVLGLAAECGGVSQRADEVEHLDDRARPAVGDDQRQGVLVTRRDVDEVDVQTVDSVTN